MLFEPKLLTSVLYHRRFCEGTFKQWEIRALPVQDLLHLGEVSKLLAGVSASEPLTTTNLREVTNLSRDSIEWAALKKHGVEETSGNLHAAVVQLLTELASKRLHVVPGGELEGWFRSAPGRSGAHVATVLDKGLHTDPALNQGIRQFTLGVVDSLS